MEKIDVFVCRNCGYEDGSIIPCFRKNDKIVKCPNCNKEVENNILEFDKGDCLTFKEYAELLKFINENHSFRTIKGKRIKYVSHTFDMRTMTIYRVTLDDKEFCKVNENRHKDMKKWIYEYLNS